VLVVEDDHAARFAICGAFRALGLDVLEADSCASASRGLDARPDVVVTDLCLPDGDAIELIPKLHAMYDDVPVFVVTGHGTIDLAVRAVKCGAEDFLTKPVDLHALSKVVRSAADRRSPKASGARRRLTSSTILAAQTGKTAPLSDAMKQVEEQIERLRSMDCTVLLLGETGTGKSLLARRIHSVGARQNAPFVDINCAGLTREFVESELFGHERGAFTGAQIAKSGLLDEADGGTLFLDEIGDVDALVQPKLLKVLEEKRFRRMGDVRERSVDVRLIAATHHDLLALVGQKRFRADLYYRVSTVTIRVPALRERREDILPLCQEMLATLDPEREVGLSRDAREALLEHRWPGNLRELKNVLERSLVLRSGPVIRGDELRFDDTPRPEPSRTSAPPPSRTLSEMEREHIRGALAAEHGRVEAAARRLGIPRSTLYQRIKAYGLEPSKRSRAQIPGAPESSRGPDSSGRAGNTGDDGLG
jgi:DNA-binding NtrC family response regulator